MSDIQIGREYKRSPMPYDVVKVVDIIVKDGRCIIRCINVYDAPNGPLSLGPEDTKYWSLFK